MTNWREALELYGNNNIEEIEYEIKPKIHDTIFTKCKNMVYTGFVQEYCQLDLFIFIILTHLRLMLPIESENYFCDGFRINNNGIKCQKNRHKYIPFPVFW